jgi:two-component system cell cycle response regulator DivK
MRKSLLVENNEDNRNMLTHRLTRQGFEVCSAVDGPAGVAMASTESPARGLPPAA